MPSNGKADFSRDRMPVLGTWVTLVQDSVKGSKARRTNTQSTPALVSALFIDGTVTVLYPNNLVLRHGFKGQPVKRLAGVAVEKLKRFSGSDISLQILEKAILTAVKADACSRVPTTPLRRPPATPQRQALPGESSSQGERHRSRSRSPLRNEVSAPKTPRNRVRGRSWDSRSLARQDTDEKVSAPPPSVPQLQDEASTLRTPRHRVRGKSCDSRSLACQDTDDKVCALPRSAPQLQEEKVSLLSLPGTAANATPRDGVESGPSTEQGMKIDRSPKSLAGRKAALTSLVSRELRASSTFGRVTRDCLEASLLEGGFDAAEISEGLQRLDDANKVMLMDSLVFLV